MISRPLLRNAYGGVRTMNSGEDYLEALLKQMTGATEEPPVAEPVIEEPKIDEPVAEEPSIDDLFSVESISDEPVIEESIIEEPKIEESVAGEPSLDDLFSEEPISDEPKIEESIAEEPSIDDLFSEEPISEEPVIEEPAIEESIAEEPSFDDLFSEKPISDEPVIEEPIIEEPISDEPVIEEPIFEDDPISDDELPKASTEEESGDILQDEDISNLLASLGELDATPQTAEQPAEGQEIAISPEELEHMADVLDIKDLTPEEPEQPILDDNADVTELLDQISDDSELNEINELLKKNDNNESVEEDDILAMLESASSDNGKAGGDDIFAIEEPLMDEEEESEEESEPTGKKKRKKREKKEKVKKEKKPGLLARLFNSLTEEETSDEAADEVKDLFEASAIEGLEQDEAANQELLEELSEEDQAKQDKKGKKGKKEKKEKKPKEKKPKKIKAPKPEKPVMPAGKKLPKKHVTVIAIMCASIGALMIAFAFFYPYSMDMKKAEESYQNQDYEMAYESLLGHHLNDEEQNLYDRTVLMLRLDRKYQSYLNYTSLGMDMEAMNALLQGFEAADKYMEDAELLGIMAEYREKAQQIEDMLLNQYGISADLARQWLAIEDPQIYSRTVSDFLNGTDTLNLQTKDGQPYEAEEGPSRDTSEQPDNPIIEGEEEAFLEEGEQTGNSEPTEDSGLAESSEPTEESGQADENAAPIEEPNVAGSIQSEPPAEGTGALEGTEL